MPALVTLPGGHTWDAVLGGPLAEPATREASSAGPTTWRSAFRNARFHWDAEVSPVPIGDGKARRWGQSKPAVWMVGWLDF